MKFKLIFLSLVLLSFLNCQTPTAVQNDGTSTGSLQVTIEVPFSGVTRGIFSDTSITLITVKVTDVSDVEVGTGTLTKGSSVWSGTINLTTSGTLTFSVRAVDGSNIPLYGGVTTEIITGTTTITVPVLAKVLMGGSVQGVPLDLTKTVSSFAGYGFAGADGTGLTARFNSPEGVTSDGTNLYIADFGNNTIRKMVIATGVVTTMAGTAGSSGSADGTGSAARFFSPQGITHDGTNLFVADYNNHTIRKIVIATGVVTTLAGSPGSSGSADGTGSVARFKNPSGIYCDGTNLFVTEYFNHTIRKVEIATGAVTTLAGLAGTSGSADGTGSSARFYSPGGVTSDGTNLYVTDGANHTIRQVVIATGIVTTLAGSAGLSGSADGTGSVARFNGPKGITRDGLNLYVADIYNHTIRQVVIATGEVTTLVGTTGLSGSNDGTGSAARFKNPSGITNDGTNLYVAESGNYTIRKVVISTAVVTTLAGTQGISGSTDGTGSFALFTFPHGLTSDGLHLYAADTNNHTIRKIVIATGVVTTLAGLPGASGSTNGTGSVVRFSSPQGITGDGTNLYIADTSNHTIRMLVLATGVVTTLAGSPGTYGSTDGTGSTARFKNPSSITSDGTNLYVADTGNHTIRQIVISSGEVSTLTGTAGVSGSVDGTGTAALFNNPYGITNAGMSLYITDTGNQMIRKVVIATGVVSTIAGSAGATGSADGTGTAARFYNPWNITSDGINLFIVQSSHNTIRKIVIATGEVSTVAGSAGLNGLIDGQGGTARFKSPQGITTDGTNLFVADSNNHTIRKIQ